MRHCFYTLLLSLPLLVRGDDNTDMTKKPLKLMYDQSTFHARVIKNSEAWTSMFACPAKENDFATIKPQHPKARCLVPSTFTLMNNEQCSSPVKPRIIMKSECYQGRKLYAIRYDICYRSKDNPEVEQYFPINVYSVCYDENENRTLYTKHVISSSECMETPDPESYVDNLQTSPADDFDKNLGYLVEAYKNINENETKGTVIPQMLVPATNLNPMFARKSNFHYLNTSPQWSHLHESWKSVNETLWTCISLESYDAQIYTGTLDKWEFEDNNIQRNDSLQLTIPSIWWTLITAGEDKAIVIILYNVASKSELKEVRRACKKSICEKSYLAELNSPYIQCCKVEENVVKILEFIGSHLRDEVLKFPQCSNKTTLREKISNMRNHFEGLMKT